MGEYCASGMAKCLFILQDPISLFDGRKYDPLTDRLNCKTSRRCPAENLQTRRPLSSINRRIFHISRYHFVILRELLLVNKEMLGFY